MIHINHNRNNNSLSDICNEHYIRISKPVLRKVNNRRTNISLKDFLTANENFKLQEIITALPQQFDSLTAELLTLARNNNIRDLKKQLNYIFNYDNFSRRTSYSPFHLATALNIKVCPYCNRKYTYTVTENGDEVIRPEFDHFYNEADHPLFSISFYNLVPSCSDCNRLKGAIQFKIDTHIHPYFNSFGQHATFNFRPHDYNSSIGNGHNMSIYFEYDLFFNTAQIEANNRDLKIDTIYSEGHSSEVADIVKKYYITNGEYLRSLHAAIPNIGTIDELYMIAFGNYIDIEDFEKRPLAKLTYDIVDKISLLDLL